MVKVVESKEYLELLAKRERPGQGQILAFYEHSLGVICKDARLMLAPLDDHLVHRGDGVFETLKYLERKIYQLEPHLARLKRSSSAIFLNSPCSWEELRELVLETARAGGEDQGYLRILLGRGAGGFGIDPDECPIPSLYIVAYRFTPKPEALYQSGVSAMRTSIPAKQPYMATIKSTNYLPNMLMKRESKLYGADFPLCFDESGCLAEGATENVCLVDAKGALVFPELTSALTGTTLVRAKELIAGEVEIKSARICEDELFSAREIIILGTTGDAIGVVRYNGQVVAGGKPGPVSARLRELLRRDHAEFGTAF